MKTDNDAIYMVDVSGRLFRKGEHIGDLVGEAVTLFPGMGKFRAAVTRWLREAAAGADGDDGSDDDAEDGGADGGSGAGGGSHVAALPGRQEEPEDSVQAGIDREMREETERARAIYLDDLDFASRTGCPQPPKKNPHYGDKTPAFVEWLHRYRHDQFMIRYGVTGKGRVPVVETNPQTGMDEVTGYRETYFARRKTHLTERDVSREGLSDDMDWNA